MPPVLFAVATTSVGASGLTNGVTSLCVGVEYAPLPAALIAATLKVYAVPVCSPVTVCVVTAEADDLTKEVHVVEIHD